MSKPYISSWKALFMLSGVVLMAAAAWTLWPAARMSEAEFGGRLRAYLLANPEVIMEAVQRLEQRAQNAADAEALRVLDERSEEVLNDDQSPTAGNPNGDVTIIEFFDYNCQYCRQVAPVLTEAIASDPQLRVVYKEFPVLGASSVTAAKAALAAHRQGQYKTFHEKLMSLKTPADDNTIFSLAANAGLDLDRLKMDMGDATIEDSIRRNRELANALRVDGTPGFVIGREIIRGAIDLDTMKSMVKAARSNRGRDLGSRSRAGAP